VAYCLAMTLATHWPDLDRYADWAERLPAFTDKVVHACLYAGWAGLWGAIFAGRHGRVTGRIVVVVLVFGAAWAAADELTQVWVGRHVSGWDFAADMLGAGAGLAVLGVWRGLHMTRGTLSS